MKGFVVFFLLYVCFCFLHDTLPVCVCVSQAHLKRAGLLGDGEEVPANLWGSPVEASMMGMPSMSAGGALYGSHDYGVGMRCRGVGFLS